MTGQYIYSFHRSIQHFCCLPLRRKAHGAITDVEVCRSSYPVYIVIYSRRLVSRRHTLRFVADDGSLSAADRSLIDFWDMNDVRDGIFDSFDYRKCQTDRSKNSSCLDAMELGFWRV